jgi:signal peptidase I
MFMTDVTHDEMSRRKYPARAGVTALNLIAPGLGLARLGNWRAAVPFLLAPFALFALFTLGMGHFPITSYGRAIFALTVVFGSLAALYLVPAVLTWHGSKFRSPSRGWSRWYGLIAIAAIVIFLSQLALPLMHRFYKPFYAPSESMAPTIGKGDKFIADMRWRGPVKRGEIVIFKGPYGIRISRIVAIPGDRIAMHGGLPILNGNAAVQSPDGQTTYLGYDGSHSATMLTERLPGEASTHRVLDTGPSEFDEMREVVVPADTVFVIGDNRDSSADSRVPSDLGGVGMVPSSAIIGRPMYIHWSADHSRIGIRLSS